MIKCPPSEFCVLPKAAEHLLPFCLEIEHIERVASDYEVLDYKSDEQKQEDNASIYKVGRAIKVDEVFAAW